MILRNFRDSSGIDWQVSGTVRGAGEPVCGAWLTFECGRASKRLSPVPVGWETASPAKLDQMCRVAEPFARQALAEADEVETPAGATW